MKRSYLSGHQRMSECLQPARAPPVCRCTALGQTAAVDARHPTPSTSGPKRSTRRWTDLRPPVEIVDDQVRRKGERPLFGEHRQGGALAGSDAPGQTDGDCTTPGLGIGRVRAHEDRSLRSFHPPGKTGSALRRPHVHYARFETRQLGMTSSPGFLFGTRPIFGGGNGFRHFLRLGGYCCGFLIGRCFGLSFLRGDRFGLGHRRLFGATLVGGLLRGDYPCGLRFGFVLGHDGFCFS